MVIFLLMMVHMVEMDRPADWRLEAQDGRVRCISPDGRMLVAVEPVVVQGEEAGLLARMLRGKKAGPVGVVGSVKQKGSEAVFSGSFGGVAVQARAMVAVRGGAGTLYVLAAPAEKFRTVLPQMVKMLESVRMGSGGSGKYKRQVEPRENSYSAEFPEGWRAELGLFRAGAMDTRYEASAVTQGATVFVGDRNLGNYIVPTQFMASLGFREGSMYNASGISASMLLRYLPGAQMGNYWLNQRLRGARVLSQRERPDLAQQVGAQRYRLGNPMRAMLHAGEVNFEFQGQQGQVMVVTEVYPSADTQSWTVVSLYGYFAEAARQGEARAAVAHAMGSWQVNLQWLAMERKYQRIDAENAISTIREINDIYRRTMAERGEVNDRIARVRGDLLAGSFRVVDPVTGETGTVQATSNYYYRVLDPNSPPEPVNLRRLLRVDWD